MIWWKSNWQSPKQNADSAQDSVTIAYDQVNTALSELQVEAEE